MTLTSVAAAQVAENEFRLGGIISRSGSMLWRHFLTFFIVSAIANSPALLPERTQPTGLEHPGPSLWAILGVVLITTLVMLLSALGQAIIIHAALQEIRGLPVRLLESLNVCLRRFFPLIGLAFVEGSLFLLGLIFLIVPGLVLVTMWFVGLPACVVERLGPWTSLRRSRQLTKGHRWKVFWLALLLLIASFGNLLIGLWLTAVAGPIVAFIGKLIWIGTWAAFGAVVAAVTYHDLRMAKEGIVTDQIAAVFD